MLACILIGIHKNTAQETESLKIAFSDSSGREVWIPENIQRIIPASYSAQIMLYTLCPDKLVSLARNFKSNGKFIKKKYTSLPVLDSFYDSESNFNSKSIGRLKPDVIIETGVFKKTTAQEMDRIQEITGIPVVFIEMTLDTMPGTVTALGDIVNESERAQELSQYISNTLEQARVNREYIPYHEHAAVYFGLGESGLKTPPNYSEESAVISYIGADNAAEIDFESGSDTAQATIDELMMWNPDVILFSTQNLFNSADKSIQWDEIMAVSRGSSYLIPSDPFEWMGSPASVNQVLGVKWLGNLIYPDIYDYDIVEETMEFYRLFYNINFTEKEAKEMLNNSSVKLEKVN